MPVLPWLSSVARTLFHGPRLEHDLDEELASWVEQVAAEKIRSGLSPARARREARLELGGVEQVRIRVREARAGAWLQATFEDARYALRKLRLSPGFTAVAVLVLAVGVGATTALFSTLSTVLMRELPFAEPERLVSASKTLGGEPAGSVSRLDYFDYRESASSFESLAAMASVTTTHTITGSDRPQLVNAAWVTWNLFETLGVGPILGRSFVEVEEVEGGDVTLISHALWQERFAGAPTALGSVIGLDGAPMEIIGVMPAGFRLLLDADLWRLVDRTGPFDTQRDSHSHVVVGRLAENVTLARAQSEVDLISDRLRRQYPKTNEGKGLALEELHRAMVAKVRLGLLLLMSIAILVLLIACSNVTGLLLARGQSRLPEMSMRAALGAPRARLVRQMLTEATVLAILGGAAGVGLARVFRGLLLGLLPPGEIAPDGVGLGVGALWFALALSLGTGLVIGVIPAVRATSTNPSRHLGTGPGVTEEKGGTRLRSGLIVAQISISVVLLVGSALLISSLVRLADIDLGFDSGRLLTGSVSIRRDTYATPAERYAFFASLLEQIEALPGVEAATMANKLPILSPWQDWAVWRADRPRPNSRDQLAAMARWVPPGYFATMGMPLLAGRDISPADRPEGARVVVIGESVARAIFPGEDPVGLTVKLGFGDGTTHQVVGVVADARLNMAFLGPDPAMYMAASQMGPTGMQLAVRAHADPNALVRPIERLLQRLDEDVLFADPRTMDSVLLESTAGFRTVALASGAFAGLALTLAAMGLYGLLAYAVVRRRNEIGVRLALGATTGSLVRMVLRQGMVLVVVGLTVGLTAALAGSVALRELLFGTTLLDVPSWAGAVLFLAAAAAIACLLPAWQAARVQPAEVLRQE